jgi:hypothetical protein
MAAGLESDKALLCDSEDWLGKMRIPGKPRNQSRLFQAAQPPPERSREFGENPERQQFAQLVETNRAGVPHLQ